MTLLAGIRNLLARRREPATPAPADPRPVVIETGLREEIEAKPAKTTRPDIADAGTDADTDAEDDTDLMDIDDLDDLEELDETDLADRLEEMETRLGAGDANIQRLVKELDGHVESNAARSEDLVQQLDERIQSQALETQQVVRKLDARFEVVADESKRLAEKVEQLPALADQVADISRQCKRLLELIDDTARIVSDTDKRSESLVHDLRQLQGRTAGLDDAITRIGKSVEHLETTFPVLLERARKSMLMFVFACMALAVLAIAGAIVALIL